MAKLIRVTAGSRPQGFSTGTEDHGTTTLVLQTGTIHIDGDLQERRAVAEALASAVGLSVVDTSKLPMMQHLA